MNNKAPKALVLAACTNCRYKFHSWSQGLQNSINSLLILKKKKMLLAYLIMSVTDTTHAVQENSN